MTEFDFAELEEAILTSERRDSDGMTYLICPKCDTPFLPGNFSDHKYNCGNWQCHKCGKWFLAVEYGGPKASKAARQKHMQERHRSRLASSKTIRQGYRRCPNHEVEWYSGSGRDECPLCSKDV